MKLLWFFGSTDSHQTTPNMRQFSHPYGPTVYTYVCNETLLSARSHYTENKTSLFRAERLSLFIKSFCIPIPPVRACYWCFYCLINNIKSHVHASFVLHTSTLYTRTHAHTLHTQIRVSKIKLNSQTAAGYILFAI